MIRKIKLEIRLTDIEALASYLKAVVSQLEQEKIKALPGNLRDIELHRQMALILFEKIYKKIGRSYAKGIRDREAVKLNLTYPEAYFLELVLLKVYIPFRDFNAANNIIAQIDKQLL